ncbi:flagellar biosynthesis protein FlhB [Thermoproteota archaeon]
MGEESGEKTEEPTPHKLREARKKGQIAKSKEFTAAIMLLVSFNALRIFAKQMWENLVKITYYSYDYIPLEFTASIVGKLLKDVLYMFAITLAPIFAINFIVALLIEMIQTGFLLSFFPLTPKIEKLNPIEGMKKFFSLKQYIELLKSLAKMIMVIYLIYSVLREDFFMVVLAHQLTLWQVMAFTGSIVIRVIIRVGLFYFFIAVFDYLYQRYEYMKSMRMSKKEIKDEYKRLEGDPMIKQRQKEAQRQMAQGRQMGAVPSADVVVTNPVHLALAIKYEHNEMRAPVVVAKGKRLVAQAIKALAEENEVPIIENQPLAQALFAVTNVDQEVPPEYYRAVAEILAFVYNLKNKRKTELIYQ